MPFHTGMRPISLMIKVAQRCAPEGDQPLELLGDGGLGRPRLVAAWPRFGCVDGRSPEAGLSVPQRRGGH